MISLILIGLLGLFCCSSINTDALDNTKEINASKEKVINNAVQIGNSAIIWTFNDFTNELYLENLMSYLHQVTNTDISQNFRYDVTCDSSACYSLNLTTFMATLDVPPTRHTGFDSVGFNLSTNSISGYKDFVVTFDLSDALRYRLTITFNYTDLSTFYSSIGNFSIPKYHIIRSQYETFNTGSHPLTDREFAIFVPVVGGINVYNILSPINKLDQNTYYNNGFYDGYDTGFDNGYNEGNSKGYQTGYTAGYDEASNLDQTALTIFTGFIEVGLLPVNVFLQILNFEVFGINIGGLVSAFLTIAIVIIIVRIVTGKKND